MHLYVPFVPFSSLRHSSVVTHAHRIPNNRWNEDHSSPTAAEELNEQERIEANIHGFGSLSRRQSIKPIIAAVRGGAYGGGVEMLLNCDLVVADEKAVFALPEVKRGVVAVQGGQYRQLSGTWHCTNLFCVLFLFYVGRRYPPARSRGWTPGTCSASMLV